jgi:hypothetical protein
VTFTVWRSLTDRFGVDLFCGLFLETTSYENSASLVLSSRSASGATARNRKGSDKIDFARVDVVLVASRSSSAPAMLKAPSIVWNSSTAAFYIRMGSAGRRTVSRDNFRRANDSIFVGGES